MNISTWLRRLSALSLATAMAFVTGCGSGETNVERGNRDGVLYWGNGTEPQELDPHITTGVPEFKIQLALFEPLVNRDPETLAPTPGAASSWEIADNYSRYTFHLNPAAKWSNGEPVTAEDFRWSMWRAMHPKLGNQYAYMYAPIKNADAFTKGKLQDFDQVGIRVLDRLTLEFTLESPTPYFLGLLGHHSFFPVHRASIEAFGDPWKRGSHWTRPGNLVGNGAFILTEWQLFKVIAVAKNPHYHSADQVALNGIRFIPTENITTEERMFRAEQLHVTNDLPADKFKLYQQTAPQTLHSDLYLGTYFYRVNTRKPPFDDQRVRLALAMTVNRDHIVEYVTKQGQVPSYTITPPNTAGYTADSTLRYDPARARQLLAEAGYPDGRGIGTVEVLYNTSENHRKIAVAIQQMWKRELNIDVVLRNEDWQVYLASEKAGNFTVSRASWIGDYLDPNTFLDMWVKDGGNNRTGWSNPEFDRLVLERAPNAATQSERYQYLKQAESILLDEMPVIPFYTYTTKYLVHPSVNGLTPNLLNQPIFTHISLQADNEEPKS